MQGFRLFVSTIFIILVSGCHSDDARSMANKCRDHYRAESYKVALRTCVTAAKDGHLDSQWIAANIFMRGLAGKQNMAESARWLTQAANHGHTAAQRELGKSYMSDARGLEQNAELALKWLKLAAREGDDDAEFNIGIIFLGSFGREADQASAVHWFKKSAGKGNSGAVNNLAWIYSTSPNKSLRNGVQAVKILQPLVDEKPDSPILLDTLAAAYAESGNYDQAVVLQQKANAQLPNDIPQHVLDGYIERLALYQQGKPWRESQPDWVESETSPDNS